ncbi:MAG TPA: glycosyltransferase [Thermoplasmata archaeon]|nr:glycosyltransferase [Thermoplasmata archaeon]
MGLLKVTVIVTVLDDPRLARCLESLQGQERAPDEVLIADGGNSPEIAAICRRYAALDPRYVHLKAPGSITDSRNAAIAQIRNELIAFLDTDEVAPPQWLGRLVAPIEADEGVGFAGGPTPALAGTARNRAARYYDAYLQRFYDTIVRSRPWAIPMGNSAFRKRLFEELGPLVAALTTNGAEDQDFENRAVDRGWRAAYVPEAFVYHDYAELDFPTLLRRQYRYASGAYVVWRKHGRTYEASRADSAYLGLPALAVVGAILVVIPGPLFRLAGAIALLGAAVGFAALWANLAVQGRRGESRFPGYRFRPWIEPFRKWATMLGAISGMLAHRRESRPAGASGQPR